MDKRRLFASVLFSLLFVGTVFVAVLINNHIIFLSVLASLFSILAIISILKMAPFEEKTAHPHREFAIKAIMVLSSILLCAFSVFLILFLLGKESLDWQISVLGIIANASLLCYCLISEKTKS